ncbi:MAG: type II toxin-antitoxin system RelE/ParE family toxin [Pirellulaceae bacterium]
MKPAIVQREAAVELEEDMVWYEKRQTGLGLDLESEVEKTIARIRRDPSIGIRYRNTQFQFVRVKRFPYVVYFREFDDAIWVIAIAHGRRRPGYWKNRKP